MKVVVTGTSSGIGRDIATTFLLTGHEVYGIDIAESTLKHAKYQHLIADVSQKYTLPLIKNVNVLINNAGTWSPQVDAIDVNLRGVINCTREYGLQPSIKAIVNIASTSAHNGAEYPEYAASKGGVLTYTKWTAQEIAKYKATCNSISPGGVYTESNEHILSDKTKLEAVHNETLLGKWAYTTEIAEWVYFLAVTNESVTGQDIIIDNGEMCKFNFIQ